MTDYTRLPQRSIRRYGNQWRWGLAGWTYNVETHRIYELRMQGYVFTEEEANAAADAAAAEWQSKWRTVVGE